MDRIHRRRPHPLSSCRRSRNRPQHTRKNRRNPSHPHRSCMPCRPGNPQPQTHRIHRRRPHPLSSCRRSRNRLQHTRNCHRHPSHPHCSCMPCRLGNPQPQMDRIHRRRPHLLSSCRRSRNRLQHTRNCHRHPSHPHRSCKPCRPGNPQPQTASHTPSPSASAKQLPSQSYPSAAYSQESSESVAPHVVAAMSSWQPATSNDRIHRRRPHLLSSCRRSRTVSQHTRNCHRHPSHPHCSCMPCRPGNPQPQMDRIHRRRPHLLSSCRRSRNRLQHTRTIVIRRIRIVVAAMSSWQPATSNSSHTPSPSASAKQLPSQS